MRNYRPGKFGEKAVIIIKPTPKTSGKFFTKIVIKFRTPADNHPASMSVLPHLFSLVTFLYRLRLKNKAKGNTFDFFIGGPDPEFNRDVGAFAEFCPCAAAHTGPLKNKAKGNTFDFFIRRSRADSNRCRSFCRALPSHSATGPWENVK